MRFSDYMRILIPSLGIAGLMSWLVVEESKMENFIFLSVIFIFIGYFIVRFKTRCPSCKKPFKLTETEQEDISNHVKYKNEVRDGVKQDVPYNVREYYQYMQCDNCGFEFKKRKTSEQRS